MRALWCVHTINVMLNNMSLFVSNSYIEFVNSIQALGLELASSRWAKKIKACRQKQHLGMYIYMTWWPHINNFPGSGHQCTDPSHSHSTWDEWACKCFLDDELF